jgi:hypothetical protein
LATPSRSTSSAVAAEPASEPRVPPTPMNANSRFACPLRKVSAITDQKTDTTNMLNTLVQTKKARPVHTGSTPSRAAT